MLVDELETASIQKLEGNQPIEDHLCLSQTHTAIYLKSGRKSLIKDSKRLSEYPFMD